MKIKIFTVGKKKLVGEYNVRSVYEGIPILKPNQRYLLLKTWKRGTPEVKIFTEKELY